MARSGKSEDKGGLQREGPSLAKQLFEAAAESASPPSPPVIVPDAKPAPKPSGPLAPPDAKPSAGGSYEPPPLESFLEPPPAAPEPVMRPKASASSSAAKEAAAPPIVSASPPAPDAGAAPAPADALPSPVLEILPPASPPAPDRPNEIPTPADGAAGERPTSAEGVDGTPPAPPVSSGPAEEERIFSLAGSAPARPRASAALNAAAAPSAAAVKSSSDDGLERPPAASEPLSLAKPGGRPKGNKLPPLPRDEGRKPKSKASSGSAEFTPLDPVNPLPPGFERPSSAAPSGLKPIEGEGVGRRGPLRFVAPAPPEAGLKADGPPPPAPSSAGAGGGSGPRLEASPAKPPPPRPGPPGEERRKTPPPSLRTAGAPPEFLQVARPRQKLTPLDQGPAAFSGPQTLKRRRRSPRPVFPVMIIGGVIVICVSIAGLALYFFGPSRTAPPTGVAAAAHRPQTASPPLALKGPIGLQHPQAAAVSGAPSPSPSAPSRAPVAQGPSQPAAHAPGPLARASTSATAPPTPAATPHVQAAQVQAAQVQTTQARTTAPQPSPTRTASVPAIKPTAPAATVEGAATAAAPNPPLAARAPLTGTTAAGTPDAAAPSGIVVQVGAVPSEAAADLLWSRAASAMKGAMTGKTKAIQPVQKDGATLYRSEILGFSSRAEAGRFCAAATAKGLACFVRP